MNNKKQSANSSRNSTVRMEDVKTKPSRPAFEMREQDASGIAHTASNVCTTVSCQ